MRGLLCVKSILTLIVGVTLAVLVITHPDEYRDLFQNVCVMTFTFYFAHQSDKVAEQLKGVKKDGREGSGHIDVSGESGLQEGKRGGV